MEKDISLLHQQIADLQHSLYSTRQAYASVRQQKASAEGEKASLMERKAEVDAIIHQIVPKTNAGFKAIQNLQRGQLRDLRVLRQLPVDAQRAVEVMYIILRCDSFKEVDQLQAVEFDDNAFRMMLNMDEYMRKIEAFDAQKLADRPHILQYIAETYFGGLPVHQNGGGLCDAQTPSLRWDGDVLHHDDMVGTGRLHKERTKLPPLRRTSQASTRSSILSRENSANPPAHPLSRRLTKRPAVATVLPKCARLPALPGAAGARKGSQMSSHSQASDSLSAAAPRGRHRLLPDVKSSEGGPREALGKRRGQRAAVVQAVYMDGSELPEQESVVEVEPLTVGAVNAQNRTIGSLLTWCLSQMQYAEILRKHGPVLEQSADLLARIRGLEEAIACHDHSLALHNSERRGLEEDIKRLTEKHHVQHLKLAHLLHDKAAAPDDEEKMRKGIELEESKSWGRVVEHWDRYWRELRLKSKQLMKEEEEYRAALETQQHAARRKTTEAIHQKLALILEFAHRRLETMDTERPQIPLPWY